jgi:hypothetical protein
MMKILTIVAVLAVVPSCTIVGAATGYSIAGARTTATDKSHASTTEATAAGAVIGLIVDAAIISAAVSYEASHSSRLSICGPAGCDGY